jgi:hypothetical protein
MVGAILAHFTIADPCSRSADLTAKWNRQILVNDGLVKMAPCWIAIVHYRFDWIWARYTDHIGQDYCGFRLFILFICGDRSQGESAKEQQNSNYDFHRLYLCTETEWTCPAGPFKSTWPVSWSMRVTVQPDCCSPGFRNATCPTWETAT